MKKFNPRRLVQHPKIFFRRMRSLFSDPIFQGLTIVGNLVMVFGALCMYLLEHASNPKMAKIWDALWWAVSTVTTVGYGDVIPITLAGRCLGMLMMVFGVALFSSFTALFASRLMAPEISLMEQKIEHVEKEIETEEDQMQKLIGSLEAMVSEFKALKGRGRT